MNIDEPKYNNQEILIYCMKREPHSLLFDKTFLNYDKKTIIELCEDLETQFDWIEKVAGDDNNFLDMMIYAQSLVFAAIYHNFNDILPEKYKMENN